MKKKLITVAKSLLGVVAFVSVLHSFAQKQVSSNPQLFDYDWKFSLDTEQSGWADINYDDKGWKAIDLPHDWSVSGKKDAKNPMGNDGGYFPAGIGWYRKTFVVPQNWKSRKNAIYFEGVYMNSEVYINGKSLGVHPYGYTSFEYDLSPYLKYGSKNIIAVRVDNSQQKNSRWYSGSGIYRHVWLDSRSQLAINRWGVFITTPEVSTTRALVNIEAKIENGSNTPKNAIVNIKILNKNKSIVAKTSVNASVDPHSNQNITELVAITNPALWDTDHPNLYTAEIEIKEADRVLDKTKQLFGIRSLKFSSEVGFELNGKIVKLNGGCVHHDNGSLGAAAYDRAEERKVQLLKDAGFNAVRTSHNPPSPAFLDACDRLGLMVIDEIFDGWRTAKNKFDYSIFFDQWSKRDIESMIYRDRNHPSIIMWSTGNEIIERKEPQAVKTAQTLASYIRNIDRTRPVNSAMTTWDKDWEIFDPLMAIHDVAGYNYQLHRAEVDHARVPSRIILQTESYPRDAFANWKLVQKHPYIIGDFVWTALDYLGESGIGRYYYPRELEGQHWERDLFPWHGAYCGDIDLTGWRKPISHYRSMLYNDHEKLYMAVKEPNPLNGRIKETMWSVWPTWENWTWPGKNGDQMEVEVYAKYPSVKLYLNEKLIDQKATTIDQEFKAVFSVPYQPGVLKAIGIKDGKEMETVVLKTAGKTSRISLQADRKQIYANGQDLSFVTVKLTDEHGIVRPDATNELSFRIAGEGSIASIDNANLKDTTSYSDHVRKAWNGKALAIIKSSRRTGKIQLKVSSPGLPDATLILSTVQEK